MNQPDRIERELTAWLMETAAPRTPDFLDDILAQTAGSNQRSAWTFPERWLPMSVIALGRSQGRPFPWRTVGLLAVLAFLVVAALAVYAGSQPRVPSPFGVARNGLVAYSKEGDIYTVDPATGIRRAIVTGPTVDLDPVWSLDGTRLVFTRVGASGAEVVLAAPDGGHQVLAGTGPLTEIGTVSWSPDGGSIALTSSVNGRRAITLVDTTSGAARVLDVGMEAEEPYWRPPLGDEIVFHGLTDQATGLYLLALDGSAPRLIVQVDPGDEVHPNDWSPDGKRLAYDRSPRNGVRRIHILDFATGSEVVLTSTAGDRNNAGYGRWSPDGRWMVFLDGGDECACNWLSVAPTAGGPATPVTADFSAPYGTGFAWSPDGSVIVTTPSQGGPTQLLDPAGGAATSPTWVADGVSSWQRTAP